MKTSLLIIILFYIVLTFACVNDDGNKQVKQKLLDEKTLSLMQQYCFSCHSTNDEYYAPIAPSMMSVKRHYVFDKPTKQAFIQNITNFVLQPDSQKTFMPNAITIFGLMPKLNLPRVDLELIATYLYDNQIPNIQSDSQLPQITKQYKKKAANYISRTQNLLAKNLKQAIKTKGTAYAIQFCNIEALSLTDSMSTKFDVKLKRLSDKPRKSNNKADQKALHHINLFKEQIKRKETVEPLLHDINERVIGYYPIMTNKLCLQCHGKEKTNIKAEVQNKLKQFYPNDKAIGYSENELRGLWVIEMNKSLFETIED